MVAMSMLPNVVKQDDGIGSILTKQPAPKSPTGLTGDGSGGILDILTGNTGTTRGTGDITSILTGGQMNRGDSLNIGNQDTIRSIYDFLGGGTLQANLDSTRNQIIGQHGITSGYEDLARRGLLSDAELARRGLALEQSNIGIGQGAAQRDLGAISQLLGINEQSLARQLSSVNQLLGINDQSLDRTLNTVAQLLGLNREQLGNQVAGVNLSEGINNRALRDDSVARGAYNAPGTRQGFSDIEREAELARAAAGISARQTGVGLQDRAGSAREEHATSRIGLNDRAGGAQEDAARTRIGLNQRAGDARDTLKRLDNEAAKLGLSADQISNTLNMGLERLGLESLTNANDLIQRLNSTNVEQATMAANLLAQAAQLAGLPGIADIIGGN